jgi:hypothetical protein
MRSNGLPQQGVENRSSPRSPATRKVYIVVGDQVSRCSLIDIAEGGARISIKGMATTAEEMIMVDGGVSRVHLSRVVWRSDREAGLQFFSSDTFVGPAGGAQGALRIATGFSARLAGR